MGEENESERTSEQNNNIDEQHKPIAIKELLRKPPPQSQLYDEYTELKNIDQIIHAFRYQTTVGKSNMGLNR